MKVEDLPAAVVVLDLDRIITAANIAAHQMLGAQPGSLVGSKVYDALRPRTVSGQDLMNDNWHPAAYLRGTHRITEQEVLLRRQDGDEIEVLIDGGYDRDEHGNLTGATLLIRPRHRGKRKPRSGVRIVSAVSHELRSPLTSVRGYTSLLLKQWDSVSDADRKMMLTQIDRDARRISRMISELLDIARIESGRLQLSRVEIDLQQIAADAVDKVGASYPDLETVISFPQSFPLVWADADKIEQVLINLIENACKYASAQGITITGTISDNNVAVEVTDKGPGIPEGDLPHLFQQFFRSSEGRPSGTGLGLWISRGLIEAHRGELTAESDENVGTTFRFTLPQRAFEDIHGRARR